MTLYAGSAADMIRVFGLRAKMLRQIQPKHWDDKLTEDYVVYRPLTQRAVLMTIGHGLYSTGTWSKETRRAVREALGKGNRFNADKWLNKRINHYGGKFMPAHAIATTLDYLYAINSYDKPTQAEIDGLEKHEIEINGLTYQAVRDFNSDRYNGGVIAMWLLGEDGYHEFCNGICSLEEWQMLKWG